MEIFDFITVLFIVVKLFGFVDMPWLVVLFPMLLLAVLKWRYYHA